MSLDARVALWSVMRALRSQYPRINVVARARDAKQALRLLASGANAVVPETLEAGLQMAGRVLQLVGTPDDVVLRRLDLQRELELEELRQPRP